MPSAPTGRAVKLFSDNVNTPLALSLASLCFFCLLLLFFFAREWHHHQHHHHHITTTSVSHAVRISLLKFRYDTTPHCLSQVDGGGGGGVGVGGKKKMKIKRVIQPLRCRCAVAWGGAYSSYKLGSRCHPPLLVLAGCRRAKREARRAERGVRLR